MSDSLTPFVLENAAVRGAYVSLPVTVREVLACHPYPPAIARVQAYLMARQEPLTEREVREALGLSHRAASLALAEAESWGIVERVPEPRRVGRRATPRGGPPRGGLF